MRRCALLPSRWTLTDLQLLFPMHLSRHSNSSTAVTVTMVWPSKAWSKGRKKMKILLRQTEKIELKERGGPLDLQMFTYQFEFQKLTGKSLCLLPQIIFPGDCWELQRPAELAVNLPSKVLCCVPDYSSSKRRRETRFDASIKVLCEYGPTHLNVYVNPCLCQPVLAYLVTNEIPASFCLFCLYLHQVLCYL